MYSTYIPIAVFDVDTRKAAMNAAMGVSFANARFQCNDTVKCGNSIGTNISSNET